MELHPDLFVVENLGSLYGGGVRTSPLKGSFGDEFFVNDEKHRILVDVTLDGLRKAPCIMNGYVVLAPPTFELAGPREDIYWDTETMRCAIVTCGGLAPGLNNVVQSIVNVLYERYGVRNIFGVPFGYYGFVHDPESKRFRFAWTRLDPHSVQYIDFEGGSILGSARGHSDPARIVDALVMRDINVLFTVGGDGTLAGANIIHEECKRRNLNIGVIGIPKTIDNDILWVSKSFGFETAVAKGAEALRCAQTEARGAFHGVGLVKLMGRNSGSLTATAAAAVSGIDFVLIPEIELVLEGENGFLAHMSRRVLEKGYATVAVAEGAGQNLFLGANQEFDPSGNAKLNNIGRFLQAKIQEHFAANNIETAVRYIDPSYMLRAQSTTADDSVFCANLGQNAVHAAMSGKSGMMVGYAHEQFTNVPLKAVVIGKKSLETNGPLWLSVLASTGQPHRWG